MTSGPRVLRARRPPLWAARRPPLWAARRLLLWAACLLWVACGPANYRATGVVEQVLAADGQVVVAHDEIPGVMPAMTMSFDVPDPALLARMQAGQKIAFTLQRRERSFRIIGYEVVGQAGEREGYTRLGDRLVKAAPAPAFALTDQAGRPLSLADLAGHPVMLDFVFTRCPGPCPILTGLLVAVQRALPQAAREQARFVSISLDPAYDRPEILEAYARERGADLATWSFLTGPEEAVSDVIQSYGVGRILKEDGGIEHIVITFLIDGQGRIVERYLGLEHEVADLARDLAALAEGSLPGPPAGDRR